ncbi:Aerobic cobaltochelatase subunit CobT [compost metagenome]|uniref:cobaltochelatase CobT-related protein n=1 Tax=Pseudomonas TaxID=286 RepID=UPI00041FA99B|nr:MULTISPECIES: cobalamin biosynthesis protein CobT [Pseudomonas]MCW2269580.1 cobaltochelatase CobT [Pseudomonas sp. JUb96]PRA57179.1 cobalamin biosynthesis protein CobT [Pseudomonas sp. MYb187]
MTSPLRREKRQQQLEELCAATLRALSGERRVRYRGGRLEVQEQHFPVHAPHLRPNPEHDESLAWRGVADSLALRLKHSDQALVRQVLPAQPIARLVFELLEQLRVESLVADCHPGARRNMLRRFEQWSQQFLDAGHTEGHIGLLLFTLAQMSWILLCGGRAGEQTEMLIEAPRLSLLGHFGAAFGLMRRCRHDQPAFTEHALLIAAKAQELIEQLDAELLGDDESNVSGVGEKAHLAFALLLDVDQDGEGEISSSGETHGNPRGSNDTFSYQVFSREHDCEREASSLVRIELLRELRQRLDRRLAAQGLNLPRLAKRLGALLAAPRRDGWAFAQTEGQIDAGRLSRLIISPEQREIFRHELERPHSDCLVTLLIDNSGSMRNHIESIALLADAFCRALELAGARSEILGFTTGQWNGGRPLKRWRALGQPANPGRLNELSHVVYKNAETSWRRARPSIAALLKSDLFREGIDGEALLWARQRLLQRDARRRILIVMSDGCPMDSATHQTNQQDILDLHLKQVTRQIEQEGTIELHALGVGLDLSAYYRRSLELDLSRSLDNAVFDEVLRLLNGRP